MSIFFSIAAVNDYALHIIETAHAQDFPWLPIRMISFESWSDQINKAVSQSFHQTATVLSANMERLILEAERNIYNLNNLEDRLVTLQQMLVLEDSTTVSAKLKLTENLWTRLGGNRKGLEIFDRRLALLEGLGVFRRQALAHVVAALQTVLAMSEDMEDLRERVAAPILIGATVPTEVQINIVRIGLDRLRAERIRAKKIEDITGVENPM